MPQQKKQTHVPAWYQEQQKGLPETEFTHPLVEPDAIHLARGEAIPPRSRKERETLAGQQPAPLPRHEDKPNDKK